MRRIEVITTWTLAPNEPDEKISIHHSQSDESYDKEEESVTLYSSITEHELFFLRYVGQKYQISIKTLLGSSAASKLVTVGKEYGGQVVNLLS